MRVVITEHGHGLVTKHCCTNWLLVIAKVFTITISMLVVVVRRGWLRRCKVGVLVLIVIAVVAREGMVFWVVWIWPQLCPPSSLPHSFQDLLLVCPTHHGHLLHAHVYVNIINS